MSTKYTIPSVQSIIEESENELREESKASGEHTVYETFRRQQHRAQESGTRANMAKGRSKKQRANANKQSAQARAKIDNVKRVSVEAPRDFEEDTRHRRDASSNGAGSGSSSDEDDEEQIEDPRTVLARARLTSPSMVSTATTQTALTNKSSSSSGSNSTVTQSSVSTRRTSQGKKSEVEEAPLSPAVPDPPSAFTHANDTADVQEQSDEEAEDDGVEERPSQNSGTTWRPRALMETAYEEPAESPTVRKHASLSSSASSSFHGDDALSEHPVENDTDRSTSPERSDRGHEDGHGAPAPPSPVSERVSAKIASQMAAARQRQNSWSSMQQFGTPEMPRGNVPLPYIPPPVLTSQPQYPVAQRPLPRAEKLPVTGYELLATRLASFSTAGRDRGPPIKPMYRKFEALNHRILLHLQDELSELEEQLHRLDHADTQARRMDRHIIPASRRAAEQAGGELQWHKTDILGRIGYKIQLYNQHLASFQSTQSFDPPAPEEIDDYREYLQSEQPITEAETHFLDPEEDLVLVSTSRRDKKRRHHHRSSSFDSNSMVSSVISQSVSSRASMAQTRSLATSSPPSHPSRKEKVPKVSKPVATINPLPIIAGAVALSVLVPVLSFLAIPGILGRVIVTILVALSAAAGLFQTRFLSSDVVLSKEGCMCAAIYGGVMVVIAGIMT